MFHPCAVDDDVKEGVVPFSTTVMNLTFECERCKGQMIFAKVDKHPIYQDHPRGALWKPPLRDLHRTPLEGPGRLLLDTVFVHILFCAFEVNGFPNGWGHYT